MGNGGFGLSQPFCNDASHTRVLVVRILRSTRKDNVSKHALTLKVRRNTVPLLLNLQHPQPGVMHSCLLLTVICELAPEHSKAMLTHLPLKCAPSLHQQPKAKK